MHALVTITTMLGVIQTQILEQSLDMIAKKISATTLKPTAVPASNDFQIQPTFSMESLLEMNLWTMQDG